MHQPDPAVLCGKDVPWGVPVIFDHGEIIHLDCYLPVEGVATLVQNFLGNRRHERFCYTCLAQHLATDRKQIEKVASALRVTRTVVVEQAICSACTHARVTMQFRQATDRTRPA